jgi:hypothetical protein
MHFGNASCDILSRSNTARCCKKGSIYCRRLDGLTKDELVRVPAYAGLVLMAFELGKILIVNLKCFTVM